MSIWNLKEKSIKNGKLYSDIEVDTLIIGAGMTGMTLAYFLKNKQNILVIDASQIGHGVTLGSTAKINYLQGNIYTKIKTARNENYAIKYLKSQKYAIENIKEIIEAENIDCDFKRVPSYIFANSSKEIHNIKKEVDFLLSQNIDVKKSSLPTRTRFSLSYKVEDTYIFNPIKYLYKMSEILKKNEVSVYENTKIIDIKYEDHSYVCCTKDNTIKAKNVVIATNYLYFTYPFFLPLRSYCEKSYIVVSKIDEDKNFTCINTKNPIYSCRFYDDGKDIYQISLSESHNIAFKQNDASHFERVEKMFDLKKEDIIMRYSNIDIMTPDSLPLIGEIKNNLYIASGFNTWGMTNSVLSAKIISDKLLNKENDFASVFNPNRVTFASLISLPHIIFSQAKSFIGSKLYKNKSWYEGNPTFYRENGIDYAIYIDENGEEHKVINRCPHLGCSLVFNKIENTWDCPCHSSRFSLDGKCIKGPSNYDISTK